MVVVGGSLTVTGGAVVPIARGGVTLQTSTSGGVAALAGNVTVVAQVGAPAVAVAPAPGLDATTTTASGDASDLGSGMIAGSVGVRVDVRASAGAASTSTVPVIDAPVRTRAVLAGRRRRGRRAARRGRTERGWRRVGARPARTPR